MLKLLLFLLPIITFAQDAVRVEYEVRQEFDRSVIKQPTSKVTEMLNNSDDKRYYYELFANNNNSNFHRIDQINNAQNRSTPTIGLPTIISSDIYKDFKSKELYENSVMKPKLFIKDSIQTFPWVLSKEESTILGYRVRKATYTNPTQTVQAWYSPDLPFRDGPSRFNGLPGLILQINFEVTMVVNFVSNVSFTAIDVKPYNGVIELPKKAIKVSKEEFNQEIEKKSSKFSGAYSGVEKD